MSATTEDVLYFTGKNVTQDVVNRAQFVLEVYIGKEEEEFTVLKDVELFRRAICYQAAYMFENEDIVFEQIAASSISQNDSYTTFKQGDQVSPWIAPLAIMACNKLSFYRVRSLNTGRILKDRCNPYLYDGDGCNYIYWWDRC